MYPFTGSEALNIAFSESEFAYVYHIGKSGKGDAGIFPLCYKSGTAEFIKCIESIHRRNGVDYYITANGFKGERNRENVSELRNIVIDVDCHGDINCDRNDLLKRLLWRLNHDDWGELPVPNIVHETGRGLQLWWCLESASNKLLWLWNNAVIHIMQTIKEFIDTEDLQGLEVDSVSKNPGGYFRLFGTVNTKTGTAGAVQILKHEHYHINQILESYKPEKKPSTISNFPVSDNVKALNYRRLQMLAALVDLRAGHLVGHRNNFLFYYYNAAAMVYTRQYAYKKTLQVNQKFTLPLYETEINNIRTSVNKISHYRLKNTLIIEGLSMTLEEQEQLDFKPFVAGAYTPTPNYTRDKVRQLRASEKADKYADIVDKLKNSTVTYEKIALEYGLSKPTIVKLAKENGIKRQWGRKKKR